MYPIYVHVVNRTLYHEFKSIMNELIVDITYDEKGDTEETPKSTKSCMKLVSRISVESLIKTFRYRRDGIGTYLVLCQKPRQFQMR